MIPCFSDGVIMTISDCNLQRDVTLIARVPVAEAVMCCEWLFLRAVPLDGWLSLVIGVLAPAWHVSAFIKQRLEHHDCPRWTPLTHGSQ